MFNKYRQWMTILCKINVTIDIKSSGTVESYFKAKGVSF